MHTDFIIVNAESVHMFKSALLVSEAKCCHKRGFITRSRNHPIQQMRWPVKHLRLLGCPTSELRADEDGALTKSTNFMCMCIDDLGLSAQTTGGHNSEANGMVESPIKPIIRMVRSMPVGAGFEDDLWCFAFNCAVFLSNHVCHRMTDDMPIAKRHDGNFQINAHDTLIFGSKACVLTKPQLKRQLQTRSCKDPCQCLSFEIDDEGLPSHVDGFFVGHASHQSVLSICDPESNKVHRAYHAGVDEHNVRTADGENLSLNSVLLRDIPPTVKDEDSNLDPSKMCLDSPEIDKAAHKLDPDKCATIVVHLPKKSRKLGLVISDDKAFGFPLLDKIKPTSCLCTQIPQDLHRNCWMTAINSEHCGCH